MGRHGHASPRPYRAVPVLLVFYLHVCLVLALLVLEGAIQQQDAGLLNLRGANQAPPQSATCRWYELLTAPTKTAASNCLRGLEGLPRGLVAAIVSGRGGGVRSSPCETCYNTTKSECGGEGEVRALVGTHPPTHAARVDDVLGEHDSLQHPAVVDATAGDLLHLCELLHVDVLTPVPEVHRHAVNRVQRELLRRRRGISADVMGSSADAMGINTDVMGTSVDVMGISADVTDSIHVCNRAHVGRHGSHTRRLRTRGGEVQWFRACVPTLLGWWKVALLKARRLWKRRNSRSTPDRHIHY
eukprot:856782-Prorocentrum_minimum.AAC.2